MEANAQECVTESNDPDAMRVLVLSQYFQPEPHDRSTDLAIGLSELGCRVQAITGFPCYPLGKTYDGWRQQIWNESNEGGYLLTRIPQWPDHSRSAIKRAFYYLSFALSASTIGLWRSRQADVILVYQAALPVGLAAWVISRVKRVPYVLDVVDLWPESVVASGMLTNKLCVTLIRKAAAFVYRGASKINVITKGYREELRKSGVPEERLSVVHCWPPFRAAGGAASASEPEQARGCDRAFRVVYAGAVGRCQHLDALLETAEFMKGEDVEFVVVGGGTELGRLKDDAKKCGLGNIRFLGVLSVEQTGVYLNAADALLVHLKPDNMTRVSIPSKTFSYMAAGKPILMAVEGEAGDLIEETGAGLAVEPCSPESLAVAIRHLKDNPDQSRQMGEAATAAYEGRFNSSIGIKRFKQILTEASASRAA